MSDVKGTMAKKDPSKYFGISAGELTKYVCSADLRKNTHYDIVLRCMKVLMKLREREKEEGAK